jgi:hypothetical protein
MADGTGTTARSRCWPASTRLLTGVTGSAHPAHAFAVLFAWTVPFMAVALVLALMMEEKPLSEEMIDVAAGKVEVAEY